jgi:hypothetical protein
MPTSNAHRVLVLAKPTPPAYTPASPHATDSERMIHALEFIAERMTSIEARLAHLEDLGVHMAQNG